MMIESNDLQSTSILLIQWSISRTLWDGCANFFPQLNLQNRTRWTLAACARLMRPLVRLALAAGIKHQQLEELLRELLLDEASLLWKKNGVARPNVSQISVTTGLNRKDVSQRVRVSVNDGLPLTEASAAARVFTYWLQMAGKQSGLKALPVIGASHSFESYARTATRGDVHHRVVLDELVRLGMVTESEGRVELTAEAFVPSKDDKTMLSFLADNGHDHLMAAVENVLTRQPLFLERSIFAEGVSRRDCENIQNSMRKDWAVTHERLMDTLSQAIEVPPSEGTHRMRVGIYTYFEPLDSTDLHYSSDISPKNSHD